MDPVEKAIRNALEKGDAEDRAFREKVYRSAFAALERATQANPQLTVEMAIKRRQSLQAKVTSIESEYLPAAPALPVQPDDVPEIALHEDRGEAAAPAVEAPQAPAGDAFGDAPSVALDGGPASDGGAPPVDLGPQEAAPAAVAPPAEAVLPDHDGRRSDRGRRPFAAMFVIVTLVCAAALGGWLAHETGILRIPTAQAPAPSPLGDSEDFDPAQEMPLQPGEPAGTQQLRNWITVFTPDDPSGVNAPSGATAEVSEDESGEFIRIRSGAEGAAVVFDVGQGILERIAGRKAVFDISARAEDGTQTQISISCDFGEMGDCGRQRYAVGYERGEYLFDVELPSNRPGAGGSIAVNSDFANEGKAVDIYEIKVSVLE
ncbi:hypothetical protein ABUE31_22210 [Mesorhizobium sp. ZMM04-5]|uniref:Biotin transporter BioY n=1 Tax=Mesorhizobium marinum TaxID=3228790 RepID=A0ABV3R5X6_9HYPH